MHANYFVVIFATLFAIVFAGCATMPPPTEIGEPPASIAAKPFQIGHAPVALVLSGGSARGFAHIGVIKVLEEQGLKPDIIVGTSAGSIIGALYASGLTAAELQTATQQMDATVFSDFAMPAFGFLKGEMGFIRGDKLHRFIDARLKHHQIHDFPTRFAAVATDLATGKPIAFNAGDAGLAVVASCAVPGLIKPPEISGRRYGDGQMTSPLPVMMARSLGAKIVIAVDVVYPPQDAVLYSPVSVLFQAFTVSVHQLKENEMVMADLIIKPDIAKSSGQLNFDDADWLIAAGEAATRAALPQLRALFGR
jgi:NTE family protein